LEGVQQITVKWEALGLEHTADLPGQSVIDKVEVFRVGRKTDEEEHKLFIVATVLGHTHESETYYEVPAKARLGYGFAYFGLIAYLLLMFWAIRAMAIPELA
jgi:hypothetical protein